MKSELQEKLRMRMICFLILAFLSCSFTSYSHPRIRIACIGNSITYGATIENREINSYPAQLAAMLGENYEVRNFGKNGATLLRHGNLPYMESNEYKQALEFLPDWVFLKLGLMTVNQSTGFF